MAEDSLKKVKILIEVNKLKEIIKTYQDIIQMASDLFDIDISKLEILEGMCNESFKKIVKEIMEE